MSVENAMKSVTIHYREMSGIAAAVAALGSAGNAMDHAKTIIDKWQSISSGHGRHNLILGTPKSSDVVLYQEQVRKGHEYFGKASHTFSYNCGSGEEITAVLAYDLWSDDTGGNPTRESGGVGRNEVTIRVTSQFGRGFHFKFIVYGKQK